MKCIETIIKFGANPSIAEDCLLQTPIHLAASLGEYELLQILLSSTKKYNLNQPDAHGNTPILLAASCEAETTNHIKTVMMLIERNAEISLSNNYGESILHLVCSNRSIGQES